MEYHSQRKNTGAPYPKTPSLETVDKLLKGAVDTHIHIAPEIGVVRRFDAYETAIQARDAGMAGVVVKSHNCHTTMVAAAVQKLVPEIAVTGSIVVGYATTGGLTEFSPLAVEAQAKLGVKYLWFPTFDAKFHRDYVPALKGTGINLLQDDGTLDPAAHEILEVAKDYDMVVGCGHVSCEEATALFDDAAKLGITKMVATHPISSKTRPAYSMEALHHMVDIGAVVEFCFRNTLPQLGSFPTRTYMEAMRELGAENCVMSTDFAQVSDTTPAEGLRTFIAIMLQLGMTEEEITWMVKKNPYRLLDLTPERFANVTPNL